jgi:hypothetical protein
MFESRQKLVPGRAAVQDGPRAHHVLLFPNKLDIMSPDLLRRSCGGLAKSGAEGI